MRLKNPGEQWVMWLAIVAAIVLGLLAFAS
jgi:hypothetical protein